MGAGARRAGCADPAGWMCRETCEAVTTASLGPFAPVGVSIVLDAGALIAIERDDRVVWRALKEAALATEDVVVPSTVVAQVWRASVRQARLAKVLKQCVIAPFDAIAMEVGKLCGETRTADICDAHVAIVAARGARQLFTSDIDDLRAFFGALRVRGPELVHC